MFTPVYFTCDYLSSCYWPNFSLHDCLFFCRLKIKHDSHEFILEFGTVANTNNELILLIVHCVYMSSNLAAFVLSFSRKSNIINCLCLNIYLFRMQCISYSRHTIHSFPTLPSNITCIRTPTQRAWLARIGVGGGSY